jgi:hypothetical protein
VEGRFVNDFRISTVTRQIRPRRRFRDARGREAGEHLQTDGPGVDVVARGRCRRHHGHLACSRLDTRDGLRCGRQVVSGRSAVTYKDIVDMYMYAAVSQRPSVVQGGFPQATGRFV